MPDISFRPFDTMLDEGLALKLLQNAVAGADDGELFLERRRAEALVFDDGRVSTASYDASEGFGLRAANRQQRRTCFGPHLLIGLGGTRRANTQDDAVQQQPPHWRR